MSVYPAEIMPKKDYKPEFSISELSSLYSNILIVRRSNKETKEETFNKFGQIVDSAFYEKISDFNGMSMNILGGLFETNHIIWRQTGVAAKNWDGKTIFSVSDIQNDLASFSNAIPIFLSLKGLLDITYPFERKSINDKETVKREEAKSTYIVKKEESMVDEKTHKTKTITTYSFEGSLLVEHKPSNSNFWHVQLAFSENDENKHILKIRSKKDNVPDNEQDYTTVLALLAWQRIKSLPLTIKQPVVFDMIPEDVYLNKSKHT